VRGARLRPQAVDVQREATDSAWQRIVAPLLPRSRAAAGRRRYEKLAIALGEAEMSLICGMSGRTLSINDVLKRNATGCSIWWVDHFVWAFRWRQPADFTSRR
jgi:hypothetical protein